MWKYLNINEMIKNPLKLNLGYLYYRQNNIDYFCMNQKTTDLYHVVCEIKNIVGSYQVQFEIDSKYEVTQYTCSCHSDSDCEHLACALYMLKNSDITDYPYIYQTNQLEHLKQQRLVKLEKYVQDKIQEYSSSSQKLIRESKDYYDNKMKTIIADKTYRIESIFSEEYGKLNLGFKVGTAEKKYVVKNIHDLLNRIEQHEHYQYGKNFGFVHSLSAFDDESQELIALLKKLDDVYNQKSREDNYYGYNFYLSRYIEIDESNLDFIFDFYRNVNVHNVEFNEVLKRIPLDIQKGKYSYKISLINENDYFVSNKYIYNIQEHSIFNRYFSDDEGKLRNLIYTLQQHPLYLNHEDYYQFYKYVLSPLMEYIDVNLPMDAVETTYTDIQIYGDIEDDSNIVFQLYYVNEENDRILGFNKQIVTTFKQDVVEEYFETHANYIDYDQHYASFDINQEKSIMFILEGLNFLKDYGQIFVSEALKRLGKTQNYKISAGVRISNDLLSVNLESDQIPKDEIGNILSQYRKKKKYYRLKNGDLIFLNTPEIAELDQFISQYHVDVKDIKKGKFDISKNKMFAIDNSDLNYIQINRSETFKKTIDSFYQSNTNDVFVNDKYQPILRNYQKEGIKWLLTLYKYGFNGILADDMGLGKTLQVIAMLDSLAKGKPSLVICPASLIYNWEDEVHKFSSSFKVKCVTGNKEERNQIITMYREYDLLVTSYDYIKRDFDIYENKQFNYVILDEAQYIKNQNTKNAQIVKKIKSDHRIALSGTPIENTLSELWSIFDFLMPDYLYNYHYFKSYFENDIVKSNHEDKVKKLRQMVSPFILRRTKKDVLTELPDKIEKTRFIPFNEEESKLYFASLAQANEELQSLLHVENINKVQILALLTRLRQLCCEPRMVYENIMNVSSKIKSAIDIISNASQNKQQVLLFSTFRQSLDYIAKELELNGISYGMLTGSTNKEKRRELVEAFQNNEFSVFLISLKAGGTGLNLTNAELVIHFDPWWNISVQNQATDRAHRIGQKKNVQVYKLVMKDSIEEKILALQEKKKDLADMFVENNDGNISSMSKDDIVELFKM